MNKKENSRKGDDEVIRRVLKKMKNYISQKALAIIMIVLLTIYVAISIKTMMIQREQYELILRANELLQKFQ